MKPQRTEINHNPKENICSVCIATFKRPALLNELIQSLFEQKNIEDIILEIIVVDNDAEKSAKEIVERFSDISSVKISYYTQPIQNISLTRNMALDKSTGKYIAILDDDETADPYWIRNLIETLEKFNADAVFGYVVPIFDPEIAQWKRHRELYFLPVGKTGDRPLFHYTTNCLIKADKVKKFNLRFDPKFGLTGGEDSVFFDSLSQYEATYVVCREAISYEVVPRYRTDLKFLCKRYFQKGNNEGRIINDSVHNKFTKVQKTIKSFLGIGYYSLLSLILLPNRNKWIFSFTKLFYFYGQFLAISQLKSFIDKTEYDSYNKS